MCRVRHWLCRSAQNCSLVSGRHDDNADHADAGHDDGRHDAAHEDADDVFTFLVRVMTLIIIPIMMILMMLSCFLLV